MNFENKPKLEDLRANLIELTNPKLVADRSPADRMLDATFLSSMSRLCAEQGKRLIPQKYTPRGFMTKLLEKYSFGNARNNAQRMHQQQTQSIDSPFNMDLKAETIDPIDESLQSDDNMSFQNEVRDSSEDQKFDWKRLSNDVRGIIRRIGGIDTMIGPMALEKKKVIKKRGGGALEATTQGTEHVAPSAQDNSALTRMKETYDKLTSQGGCGLFDFGIIPGDFTSTVETFFDLSSLAFRGQVEIRPSHALIETQSLESIAGGQRHNVKDKDKGDGDISEKGKDQQEAKESKESKESQDGDKVVSNLEAHRFEIVPLIECVPVDSKRPQVTRSRCTLHLDACQLQLLQQLTAISCLPSVDRQSIASEIPSLPVLDENTTEKNSVPSLKLNPFSLPSASLPSSSSFVSTSRKSTSQNKSLRRISSSQKQQPSNKDEIIEIIDIISSSESDGDGSDFHVKDEEDNVPVINASKIIRRSRPVRPERQALHIPDGAPSEIISVSDESSDGLPQL
ncbi:uncharacterized protein MONOS_11168 [Monocercomonoides exilis]|uniref:uncharacterized protein n=1 Tax=Monocercomonoides exilis TaxID=2049356 RepID=UPI00355A4D3D|nr:hypothetical protein MONOS_11168 [Monocercomonoides exilis]|eukprot:MONOS_11168.1-p1 / transcript=MONOS_11168.1 / gene=MONOS_11168 / organism=Monocercomonoides_exilis_PA203 / gene_product=unspecified product / transcript_product=unspecified product / location=Mono_scaffold00546:6670-9195(+) / protein_length=510 / sequence_SO=supercontig / SO=protein_coding / is_pseudo=false